MEIVLRDTVLAVIFENSGRSHIMKLGKQSVLCGLEIDQEAATFSMTVDIRYLCCECAQRYMKHQNMWNATKQDLEARKGVEKLKNRRSKT